MRAWIKMDNKDFRGIMDGLGEAVAHVRGDDAPGIRVHIPATIDTKTIRARLGGISQAQFAQRFGFSVGSIRDWEQGRRMPDPSTRAFLKVIANDPAGVEKILGTA